jgi:hypothetical protein
VGGLVEETRKYHRIAFDTNAVIYLFEKHQIYGPEIKEIFEPIEKGVCYGITSTFLLSLRVSHISVGVSPGMKIFKS